MTLCEKLNKYVKDKNLKKWQLAKILDTPEANVSRWLNKPTCKINKGSEHLILTKIPELNDYK